ncbi:MAG: adenylate/guanylate cyclase domain-containing protein [Gammaproteobacteria bacterium]|jgi:class 3 adenylate cyclase
MMDESATDLKQLVHTLDIGIAVVDPATWSILFENAKFFDWLPPGEDADAPLTDRIPTLQPERALGRLGSERPYRFEYESKVGPRSTPLAIVLRQLPHRQDQVLVECHDISKQKQAEYLLDSYSKLQEKHTRELRREKERGEKLLLNIMPRSVYEEMRDFGTTTPQRFESASVMLLDFVGFTDMAISHDPGGLITELNDIFTAFDRIVELFGCERIKTIGDAYMAVSGIPDANPDHAQNVARVALRIRRYLERRNAAHAEPWLCRIGINTGPVIGSIVGIHKYVYDIFGPGVNLAARMENHSEPMQITLCEETWRLINDEFLCTPRGEFEIKGFGNKQLYFLEREHER